MSDEKKNKVEKPVQINMRLFHTLIPALIMLSRIKFGLKVDKSKIKDLEGPFLVLGNHTSPVDFLFFSGCIYPKPMNYVVASNMYYTKVYGAVLRHYNTIPKKQFTSDFNCIKLIKKYLDTGTSVLLFPEGRVTVDGTTGYINPAIGKLVKWLGYPVVSGLTEGGYVGNPKWGRHKRSTKVRLGLEQILTKEDIQKMSAEEIYRYIVEKLQYNDNQKLIDNGNTVPGFRLAEGLEKILYKCPNCGAEFKHVTRGKQLTCTACGNTVIYDNDGYIKPKSAEDKYFPLINEWYKYERDDIKAAIESPDFVLSDKVTYTINNPALKTFVYAGDGVITVNKEGIIYEGEFEGKPQRLSFKIENHGSLAFVMGYNIEVSEEENIHRFDFKDGLFSTKYVLAIEEIYKKYYAK